MHDIDKLLTYETLTELLTTKDGKKLSGCTLLQRLSQYIDSLNIDALHKLAHVLYRKWPHCQNKYIIAMGIKRALQTRYYTTIYNRDTIPNSVLKMDLKYKTDMKLHDQPYQKPIKQPSKKSTIRQLKPKPNKPKPTRSINKFALEIKKMTLEQVVQWAVKLNISQDKINKHINKPLGLAKMNISNLIRNQLKRNKELEPWMKMINQ